MVALNIMNCFSLETDLYEVLTQFGKEKVPESTLEEKEESLQMLLLAVVLLKL